MEPVCNSAFSSAQCFSQYALLIVLLGAVPALFGSIAIVTLTSKQNRRRIFARIGGVWLTSVFASASVTFYLAYSDFYGDGHGDIRAVGTTVGLIFALVTAFVAAVVRKDAAPRVPPAEQSPEELRSRNPASA
jgi:hypothetical protein